jgi:hypothetical protein
VLSTEVKAVELAVLVLRLEMVQRVVLALLFFATLLAKQLL